MQKNTLRVPSSFRRNALLGSPIIGYLWALVGPSVDPRVWHNLSKVPLEDLAQECDQAWEWFIHSHGTAPLRLPVRVNHETGDVKEIRQLLRFPMKLRTTSVVRASEAIKAFEDVEAEIRSVDVDTELLERLREIVTSWFSRISLTDLPFGHGPGAVSEGSLSLADKYLAIGTDPLLNYCYGDISYVPSQSFVHRSRLIVIPKTILKDRTISAEPATLMFYQKGVQRTLYDYICSHAYLRRRIPLRDQTRNGRLALLASASAYKWNGPWDEHTCSTIDLSSASDRLSWTVVRSLFRGTPLLRHLWATRCREVLLPDGRVLPLAKFATMGSALCFPIQSIVYAACCEEAARSESRAFTTWSVFGDDIICHAAIHDRVVDTLTRLGLKVNPSKTFSGTHPFRESCGVEAYDGEDVTPVTLTGLDRSSEGILAALDKARELNSLSKHFASMTLYQWVYDNLPPKLRPFLDVGPDSHYAFPFQLFEGKRRWSKRYQRSQRPLITAHVREQSVPTDELRLYHHLLLHRQRVRVPWAERRGRWGVSSLGYTLMWFDNDVNPILPESPVGCDPYEDRARLGPLTVSWL